MHEANKINMNKTQSEKINYKEKLQQHQAASILRLYVIIMKTGLFIMSCCSNAYN